MEDLSFSVGDVISIGTIIVAVIGGWFKIKHNQNMAMKEINDGKEARQILHDRIDKTRQDLENHKTKTDNEFKELNEKLSVIQSNTSEIKGLIEGLKKA